MLELNDVKFHYLSSLAASASLDGLSLRCETWGITVLVGESGVGKSTLIAAIAGIYLGTDCRYARLEGEILIDGKRPCELRGPATVSWVPQAPLLLEHLRVIDNIVLPLTLPGSGQVSSKEDMRRLAMDLLEMVGLRDKAYSRPSALSGGMKTKVSLLRAMISRPRYLFLDEPFAGLDIVSRWNIYETIRRLRGGIRSSATFLTTHDMPEATIMADRILLIGKRDGRTIASVIDSKPVPLGDFADGEGLGKARAAASRIERLFFSRREMDD